MTKNSLVLIVLNWNGADDAINCVKSLLAQGSQVLDIIIVDNASSDDSVDKLERFIGSQKGSNIELVVSDNNGGYTAGNNIGFRIAIEKGYEFIGTLNPDAMAHKNWAQVLVSELVQHPAAGIATGILARNDKKHVDSTGDFYSIWGIPSPRGRDNELSDAPIEPEYIFGATGGGFIARADCLKDVGLFDEKFFMYFEDVDLCFRLQLAGYRVRFNPKAIAYHKLSASTNKVPGLATTQTFKNLPVLFFKNVPLGLWWKILPRFKLAYGLIFGNAVVRGRGWPALKGVFKSLLLIPHAWKERHRIQSSRKASNDYISSIILHDIPPEQTGLRKFRKFFTGKA